MLLVSHDDQAFGACCDSEQSHRSGSWSGGSDPCAAFLVTGGRWEQAVAVVAHAFSPRCLVRRVSSGTASSQHAGLTAGSAQSLAVAGSGVVPVGMGRVQDRV